MITFLIIIARSNVATCSAMNTHLAPSVEKHFHADFPTADELAAIRAWYAGMSVRKAAAQYLLERLGEGRSARGAIGRIRRTLIAIAQRAHRDDLMSIFASSERGNEAGRVASRAIEALRHAHAPAPQITDSIEMWLPRRAVAALQLNGVTTLAELTVRIPRRRQWWKAISGLGPASARAVEAFFATHPALTERARQLIAAEPRDSLAPWERLCLPHEVDGSQGAFRASSASCTLDATNDYEAVNAWLSLHESTATQRAYRKEAERLILWAIIERGRALSSLTVEDAIAYRAFVRRPSPRDRWIGESGSRDSSSWRPFTGPLSARSAAYALSVIGALFRWLIEQRYVLANPFAGVKVREAQRSAALDKSRAFSEGEWLLVRTIANGLEWSYGWTDEAAQRLRFVLDFTYATGLRASELVAATLGAIELDTQGDHWLKVRGKGAKAAKVCLPPLARSALERYLVERQLPISANQWKSKLSLVAHLTDEQHGSITTARLWGIVRRFFIKAAAVLEADRPQLAEKLRSASPHWMRHTHATHALIRGAELTTVRDNLRHASISTTSLYLHGDDSRRARQLGTAFE